ncbi:MAG: hypothetical protein GY750_10690 [Lentisphaerae bacterium]|nr:hypothetical protein [Lentisphaerota bacterium]MCP4101877.1 hypothetical protein [Lentisphaerota bacterium]
MSRIIKLKEITLGDGFSREFNGKYIDFSLPPIPYRRVSHSPAGSFRDFDDMTYQYYFAHPNGDKYSLQVAGTRTAEIFLMRESQRLTDKEVFSNPRPDTHYGLLSLNRTFNPKEFGSFAGLIPVSPPVKIYSKNADNVEKAVKNKEKLRKSISAVNSAGRRLFIPVVTKQRKSVGHHWQVLLLERSDKGFSLTVIQSTTAVKFAGFNDLMTHISETFVFDDIIKELLREHHYDFSLDEIKYRESKQFGNMGCGITAMNNIYEVLDSSKDIPVITKTSYKQVQVNKYYMFDCWVDEDTAKAIDPDSYASYQKKADTSYAFNRKDPGSVSGSLDLEVMTRAMLFIKKWYSKNPSIEKGYLDPETLEWI